MADVLIRNVDEAVIRGIDAAAARQGLSRNEYLRRELTQFSLVRSHAATREDLKRSLELLADLGDESVMAQAWG
jgi:plasmid stability protein